MVGDLAPGPDAGHAGLVSAVGEVAVAGFVAGNAAGQCPNRLDLDQAPVVPSGGRVDLLQQPGADAAAPVLRVHDQLQVDHTQVLRLGQQVRRGTDHPVAVPGQQRLFGQCGPRVLEPGHVFLSAGGWEVGQVMAGDRDHQVVPLAHRRGVGRIELRNGHARIVRRA
jgi:hypothetical protein